MVTIEEVEILASLLVRMPVSHYITSSSTPVT
jgi:hypothetical protein